MQIKEHIRRNIITINEDATFRDALKMMIEKKTNGLIVVDAKDRPVGTIDSFNLIQHAIPPHLQDDPTLARLAAEEVFHKAVSDSLAMKVKDIMEPTEGICVHEDDHMIYAATLASKHSFRYIPVVECKGDKIIGLVSRTDIKRAMADLIGVVDEDE